MPPPASCHGAARRGIFSSTQEYMACAVEKMAPTQRVDAMTKKRSLYYATTAPFQRHASQRHAYSPQRHAVASPRLCTHCGPADAGGCIPLTHGKGAPTSFNPQSRVLPHPAPARHATPRGGDWRPRWCWSDRLGARRKSTVDYPTAESTPASAQ